jgi:hypothetical protein
VPRVLQRLLVLSLLALWLPATGHCALATAFDWIDQACALSCSHDDDTAPHADACQLLEDGDYKPAPLAAAAPAPSLTPLACLACLHARLLAEARPLAPPASTQNDSARWVPSRVFATRAAPPARAPNLT